MICSYGSDLYMFYCLTLILEVICTRTFTRFNLAWFEFHYETIFPRKSHPKAAVQLHHYIFNWHGVGKHVQWKFCFRVYVSGKELKIIVYHELCGKLNKMVYHWNFFPTLWLCGVVVIIMRYLVIWKVNYDFACEIFLKFGHGFCKTFLIIPNWAWVS